MPGYVLPNPTSWRLLQGTTAIQCNKGIVTAASLAGAAGDTLLMGVYIQLNAAAVTLTIAGFQDSGGSAASMLLTGETTVDYYWEPPFPILNEFAAFTFTPSVAGKVWVATRAFTGGE